jgi:hypothetical protein
VLDGAGVATTGEQTKPYLLQHRTIRTREVRIWGDSSESHFILERD